MGKAFTFTVLDDAGNEQFSATGRNGALFGAEKNRNGCQNRAAFASGMLAGSYDLLIDGVPFPQVDIFYLYPELATVLFDRMERDGVAETLAGLDAAASNGPDADWEADVLRYLEVNSVYG